MSVPANWLCLYNTLRPLSPRPRPARPRRKLASFCTFVPSGVASSRPWALAMAFRAGRGQLGSFCALDPAGNWVRFARFPLAPRPWGVVPFGSAGNWLRFAHFALRGPGRPAKLGSFCTIGRGKLASFCPFAPSGVARQGLRAGIGFVFPGPFRHPIHHNVFPAKDLSFVPIGRKLASFCTIWFGDVGLGRVAGPCPFLPAGRRLGSFCTFVPRGQIGFVSHESSPPRHGEH